MESLELTGLWYFQPDPMGEGEQSGFYKPAYDCFAWREVSVPSDFETCHPSLAAYEGGGWYRRTFKLPENRDAKRVLLHFEGINARLKVWVNGQFAGSGNMPYLPVEFEIQDYLTPGSHNDLTVWVDNTRKPGEVPGMQRGWRTFGGILREVVLKSTDLLYLDKLTIDTYLNEDGGVLRIRSLLTNKDDKNRNPALSIALYDKTGTRWEGVSFEPQSVNAGASVLVATELMVPGVQLWSPDSPTLYTLELTLTEDERVLSRETRLIGFRTISIRGHQLLLNGEPVVLTGFNRHEDSFTHNMCTDLKTTAKDLREMKDAGSNFVRLCHYPHHPGELDLCDKLGLLVMDEIPLYWWDGLAEGEEACAHKLQCAKDQLTALIQRDRNHPSVIFWSVSNETEENRQEVVQGNDALIQLAQRLDSTRLAVHVSNHWHDTANFEYDDVVCVNAYPTWGGKIIGKDTAYSPVKGKRYWQENLEKLHRLYPHKPILVTEFGYVSFQGIWEGVYGEDVHAEVLAEEYAGQQAPYVCGATVWCWADHPWPAATFEFANYLAISPYGVCARNRRKKRAFWMIRQLFRDKHAISILPKKQANAPGPAGYEVFMVREHMDNIPQAEFPAGYGIRSMRLEDGGLWEDIWRDADGVSFENSLYQQEFSHDYQATTWRSFIVTDPDDLAVGIISAWYNARFMGKVWGQIHWVGLRRRVWGKGLGKAMMTYAMNYLAQRHERVYLGTQTNRLQAIKIYLDFGFMPFLEAPEAEKAWRLVAQHLPHPTLKALGLVEAP